MYAVVVVVLPLAYSLQVNMDGSLFWGPISAGMKRDTSSASAPVQNVSLVAPFFGDADLTSGGDVFYRSTSSPELLQRVSDIVAAASFEGLAEELPLRSLFIATWHRVPASGGPVDQVRHTLPAPEDGGTDWEIYKFI